MKDKGECLDFLRFIKTKDLLREVGKRLNIQFGTIQTKFHHGEPAACAITDQKVALDHDNEDEL
jgi:hypothetical protein